MVFNIKKSVLFKLMLENKTHMIIFIGTEISFFVFMSSLPEMCGLIKPLGIRVGLVLLLYVFEFDMW